VISDHLQQIVPGLELLESESAGRFPFSHSFVIRGEVDVLVDAGCGLQRLRSLTREWRPELVLISHSHPDHCSGAWLLQDAEILSPTQRSDIFWQFKAQSIRFAGEHCAPMWRSFVESTMGIREFSADRHFSGGESLDFGGITIECVHAPGHVDDHYVFFEPHHGIALTFDIDLSSFGPWYGHVESDIDLFLASIQQLIERRPKMILSSHKGLFTEDIRGHLERFASVVDQRDAQILELLDRPMTLSELADASPIYGGHVYAGVVLHYWESRMIEKHLERLERRGLVRLEAAGRAVRC
jgi:glyoxylase-like metal-dependent hydrolase (beta-lactamase superfamily II)